MLKLSVYIGGCGVRSSTSNEMHNLTPILSCWSRNKYMRIQNNVTSQRIIIKNHTEEFQTAIVIISYCVHNPQELHEKIQNPLYS